jgi:hypothetical protein
VSELRHYRDSTLYEFAADVIAGRLRENFEHLEVLHSEQLFCGITTKTHSNN